MTNTNELTSLAEQIGVLHPEKQDDYTAIMDATREVRTTHELDEPSERKKPTIEHRSNQPNKRHIGRKALALATGVGLLVAGGNHYLETSGDYALGLGKAPTFEGTQQWTAGQGDGISAAIDDVDNYNSVDSRFITDEINRINPEALKDGLQSGETINIPENVQPN